MDAYGRGEFVQRDTPTLDEFLAKHAPVPDSRPRLDQDRDALIELHQANHCSWWRRGIGILVGGEDFHPSFVLDRTTRLRDCGCVEDRTTGLCVQPCEAHISRLVRRARNRAVVPPPGVRDE